MKNTKVTLMPLTADDREQFTSCFACSIASVTAASVA